MNLSIKTTIATAAMLLMAASFAGAQTPDQAPVMGHGQHMMAGGGMGMGMGMIPAEKQDAVLKIQNEYRDKLYALNQDLRAKQAELNALMLQSSPDAAKAKAVAADISSLRTKQADILIEQNARIAKETGVRLPLMAGGCGSGGGCGGMGGGMGGCGGMGGGMGMGGHGHMMGQ